MVIFKACLHCGRKAIQERERAFHAFGTTADWESRLKFYVCGQCVDGHWQAMEDPDSTWYTDWYASRLVLCDWTGDTSYERY